MNYVLRGPDNLSFLLEFTVKHWCAEMANGSFPDENDSVFQTGTGLEQPCRGEPQLFDVKAERRMWATIKNSFGKTRENILFTKEQPRLYSCNNTPFV